METLRALHPLTKGEHYVPVNGQIIHYHVSGSGPVCISPIIQGEYTLEWHRNHFKPLEKHFTIVLLDTKKDSKIDLHKDIEALRMHLKQNEVWLIEKSSVVLLSYNK